MPTVGPSDEEKREMVRLYVEEDLNITAISRRCYYHRAVVSRTIREAGIKARQCGGVAPRVSRDRIVELYLSGLSMASVGEEVGLHWTTVKRHLFTAGVKIRDRSTALRIRRRETIARKGALTDAQAAILATLDAARPKFLLTMEIGRRTGLPDDRLRDILYRLTAYGLVKQRHRTGPGAGQGAPYEWARSDLAVMDVLRIAVNPPAVGGKQSAGDSLPIGPFREWIEAWIEREERKVAFMAVASNGERDAVISAVASALGVTDRRLWAFRYEQESVSIATVDRLLTNADRGVTLADLWPDRFGDFDEGAAA